MLKFLFKTGAVLVAVQAVLLGLLIAPLQLLRPMQLHVTAGIDRILDNFVEPASGNLEWAHEFNGGFFPGQPVANQALKVLSGALPDDLSGVFLRNGPNSQHWPPTKRTHVFDGDGMVHSIRLSEGKAIYNADYLQTPRYAFERKFGGEFFPRIGEWWGVGGLLKLLGVAPLKGIASGLIAAESGQANTALGLTPGNILWANHEVSMPFRIRIQENGAIESLGFDSLKGTMWGSSMSAHPKHDYNTGESFFHGREVLKRFYAGRIKDGVLKESVDLPVGLGFHHDMAISRDYIIMIDGSQRFEPKHVVEKLPLWTMSTNQTLRFGVFPRKAGALSADSFTWIDTGVTAEVVHTLHAFNDGGVISLWGPVSPYKENVRDGILGDGGPARMSNIRIDVEAESATFEEVEASDYFSTEFPGIRDDRIGQDVRYGFSGHQEGKLFNFTGLLKWDMRASRLSGRIDYPPGHVGGEPVFAPRSQQKGADPDGDDGYIVVMLWDVDHRKSILAAYDARTFEQTPVVQLESPVRVPMGFHAHWLSEKEFQAQLRTP